jgi:Uma2 family endonuclease
LDVYLGDDNVVQPDVMWIAPDSPCTIGEKHLDGPPDLVVEVLSPSTAHLDKTGKFHLYERHCVREYWIVDPVHKLMEVWALQAGAYRQQGIYGPDESFPSPVLGGQPVAMQAVFEG